MSYKLPEHSQIQAIKNKAVAPSKDSIKSLPPFFTWFPFYPIASFVETKYPVVEFERIFLNDSIIENIDDGIPF